MKRVLVLCAIAGLAGVSFAILIIPGDPDNSYLIRKVQGGPTSTGSACRGGRVPI